MKILVDHGSSYNLGDIGILEGAVSRLINIVPEAEFFIIDRPCGLRTNLWQFSNVFKQDGYKIKPFMSDSLRNVPFFWRYDDHWKKMFSKIALLSHENYFVKNSFFTYGKNDRLKPEILTKYCDDFDAYLMTGGGFNDFFLYSMLSKTCLINAFIKQAKPVILTSQQIGPFKSRSSMKILKKILKKVSFIGLREPGYSLTFIKNADIESDRFELTGDDSFGVAVPDESLILEQLHALNLEPGRFLAVNVRISSYTKGLTNYLQQIAILFEKLSLELNMPVLIVPIAFNSTDSDVTSGKKLIENMKSSDIKILDYMNPNTALTKGVLGKAYGAIGVSYHFCTFALSQGVPAICLYDGDYYAQKAKGLCLFWDDNRLAISLKNINIDSAVKNIIDILNDDILIKNLLVKKNGLISKWHDLFDNRIKQILEYSSVKI